MLKRVDEMRSSAQEQMKSLQGSRTGIGSELTASVRDRLSAPFDLLNVFLENINGGIAQALKGG